MYDWITRLRIADVWNFLWQDIVSHRLFGFLLEIGRKQDPCIETLKTGWKTS
jgi:hypothetical protein